MNGNRWTRTMAVACAMLFAGGTVAVAGGATIKGKIAWEGKPYRGKRMKNMNKQCKTFHADELPRRQSIVTNENGTLKNVLVFVKNAPAGDYPTPSEKVRLDQVGCLYTPHVLALQVGQTLEIHNGDPTAHNVHFMPKKNKEFNKSQPKKGLIDTLVFKRAEVMVPVKCDVHPWMNAFVGVFNHPFFGVAGDDGSFEISGLPGGTYTIEAKHEKYGSKTMEVTVATDETKEIEFMFSRADKK